MNDFSEEKIKEIKEAFDLIDTDKDNYINREQLENVFLCLGYNYTEDKLDNILKSYGEEVIDNDGKNIYIISLNNYMSYLTKQSREIEIEDELMDCFRDIDKDGDGKINFKELQYAFLTIGERFEDDEIRELINQVDTSGQGAFTYRDFVKLMLSK